ncbi:hypothetical protein GCM10028787_03810 [Brachybacterium horti]
MVLALRLEDGEQAIMVCDWHADWVARMECAERAQQLARVVDNYSGVVRRQGVVAPVLGALPGTRRGA